jgi:uncharacterized protein (DUF433 family)
MSSHAKAYQCDDSEFFHSRERDKDWPKCRERFISTAKDFEVPFASVLRDAASHFKYIAMDEEILGGTPRISNTRIPVYMILDAIEYYGDLNGAMKSYPQLSLEQVKEAVCFAGEVLEHPVDNESETSVG